MKTLPLRQPASASFQCQGILRNLGLPLRKEAQVGTGEGAQPGGALKLRPQPCLCGLLSSLSVLFWELCHQACEGSISTGTQREPSRHPSLTWATVQLLWDTTELVGPSEAVIHLESSPGCAVGSGPGSQCEHLSPDASADSITHLTVPILLRRK